MSSLLELISISKFVGTIPVLDGINIKICKGEVIGLTGLSNASQGILALIFAGIQEPDDGSIYFNEKEYSWPIRSREIGIEVIPHEPKVVEGFDVINNIFLGNEIGFPKRFDDHIVMPQQLMYEKASRILKSLDLSENLLHQSVANLSFELRQLITIARSMVNQSSLIFIDDSLSLLSYPYQQKILSLIRIWQQQGTAIIYGTSNLDHLFSVTDSILIFRDGKFVSQYSTDEVTRENIVSEIVGTTDQQQITPIAWALESYYQAREKAEILRHNQSLLERDIATQDLLNKQLLIQLNKQVLALDKANQALQDAQRRLHSRSEEDRKALARELHDQSIQDLLSLNYQLENIEEEDETNEIIRSRLKNIRNNIRKIIDDLRLTCSNLRPTTLDALGLGSAIKSYVAQWTQNTKIPVEIDIDSYLLRLPESTELSIFRMIQECLRNIEKHSNANSVKIHLKHTSPRMIRLSIIDDGIGLSPNFDLSKLAKQNHFGLLGVSERVSLLGGNLSIQNSIKGGVIIQAEIPHPRQKK